ncbi:ABC transporter substrate-binding protein, partial [Leucobacter sp. M11]|uniref:ABC transporter substrate-binding protein n=1 Tax=Leucobacter sp. M11 TaxID=2993565 RepID=UPI002D7F21D2
LILTGCSSDPDTSGGTTGAGDPVTGGSLSVGVVGGSIKDTLDAHVPVTHPDQARVIQLYSTLIDYSVDHELQMALAESVEPSADARTWTVTLREGLKFSDGSPITSADVIASIMRITDPDDPKAGATALADLDRDAVEAVDELTAVFPFNDPTTVFADSLAQYASGIVPADYDPENPVSSGPFMPQSFEPGQQSVFVKNPNYFREGEPFLDEVTIINFPDDTARVNALLGGQVDAIDQLPLGQTSVVEANDGFEVLESPSGSWLPFTMRVDTAPFDDVRVRQAFRLIVDRQQMVDQVLDGRGEIGNDMYAPYDACYPSDIPQRTQDIEEAKRLLAEAGQSDLTVELVTSPVAAGIVEAAQVFAQQAAEAGVTVEINRVDTGDFYGERYLDWTFAQDFWFTRDYLPQTDVSSFESSPYNETHWNDPEWTRIALEARGELDEDRRCELIREAQQIEYDTGGYIVWGFPNTVDAYRVGVNGFVPDPSGIPLTSFAFRLVWLDQA